MRQHVFFCRQDNDASDSRATTIRIPPRKEPFQHVLPKLKAPEEANAASSAGSQAALIAVSQNLRRSRNKRMGAEERAGLWAPA